MRGKDIFETVAAITEQRPQADHVDHLRIERG